MQCFLGILEIRVNGMRIIVCVGDCVVDVVDCVDGVSGGCGAAIATW